MRESDLVRKIQKYCKENNIYTIKIWGGGYQSMGIPDLILCKNGHFLAFETKVDKNKASKMQEWHIDKINKAGGNAYVIRSLEEAIECLQNVK